jgi:hypothetical protein
MKTILLIGAILISGMIHSLAQESQRGPARLDPFSGKKGAELLAPPRRPPPPEPPETVVELERPIELGGLAVDVLQSPREALDPRAPGKFSDENPNISFYPRSSRIQGIVFFAIRF